MERSCKIWKIILVVVITVALVSSLSLMGCKEEAAPAEEVAEETEIEEKAPAEVSEEEVAEEPVTIEYWSVRNEGEPAQVGLLELFEGYMAENPNVTINPTWVGRDVMTKVKTASAGGGVLPDLSDHSLAETVGSLFEEGLITNLDEYMQTSAYDSDVPFIDTFKPGIISLWTDLLGGTYVVPYYTYTSLFWYDKTMFDSFGITETPKTWDDFLDVCATLKDNGVAPIGIDAAHAQMSSYYYYFLINRLMGPGKLLEATMDKTGESWDAPEFLTAAKKVRELRDKGCFIEGYEGYQWPAGQMDWAQGKSGLLLNGAWILKETADAWSDTFEIRAFPFPTVDGKGNQNDIELHQTGFNILESSEHKDVCFDIIKYCLTKEGDKIIMDTSGGMAVIDGVDYGKYQFVGDILDAAEASHFPQDNMQAMNPEFWATVWTDAVVEAIDGIITPEELIERLKGKTVNFWKNK